MPDSHLPFTEFTSEPGRESPLHGFQGDRLCREEPAGPPHAITLAVSREAGARGGTIARRAAAKLGWQVYPQELLEYITHEESYRRDLLDQLLPETAQWVEARLQQRLREQNLSQHPSLTNLARVILALGAQGNVVLVGRGAGYVLPRETTLHVRVVAPLADRVAYMAEWLRLTPDKAAEQVRSRDSRRAEFIATHFHRQPNDVYQYDLLLNSSLLGEELSAELIAQAARAKGEGLAR